MREENKRRYHNRRRPPFLSSYVILSSWVLMIVVIRNLEFAGLVTKPVEPFPDEPQQSKDWTTENQIKVNLETKEKEQAERSVTSIKNRALLRTQEFEHLREKLLPLSTRRKTAVLCVIEKHEERYLEEWARYHLALGFDHIFVFDNSINQTTLPWLLAQSDPLFQEKVTVIDFSMRQNQRRQLLAHMTCAREYARPLGITWAAFFDPDEFLVLRKHATVIDFLRDVCPTGPNSTCGSVSMNWVRFGTNNHTSYEPLPVSHRFRYHTGTDPAVKTIARLSEYIRQRSPHWAYPKNGTMRLDTHGKYIQGRNISNAVDNPTFNDEGTVDVAAIFHYQSKSVEEYNWKFCARGDVFMEYDSFELCKNRSQTVHELPVGEAYDDSVARFLEKNTPEYWAKAMSKSVAT